MPPIPFIRDAVDLLLLQVLRVGLPLTDTPYADLGADLGLAEHEVIARLERLRAAGVIGTIGPCWRTRTDGLLLAAMQVPDARYDAVAAQLDAIAEVTHNVRREHRFNMWFAIAPADAGMAVCERIAAQTGLSVYGFPDEASYVSEWRLVS